MPDFTIIAQVAQKLGHEIEGRFPSLTFVKLPRKSRLTIC